jgi:hypothetical protein
MGHFNAEKINSYIDEFFLMERGEKISNPTEEIILGKDIRIKRIGLKHNELIFALGERQFLHRSSLTGSPQRAPFCRQRKDKFILTHSFVSGGAASVR